MITHALTCLLVLGQSSPLAETTVQKEESLAQSIREIERLIDLVEQLGDSMKPEQGESEKNFFKRVERIHKAQASVILRVAEEYEKTLTVMYSMESSVEQFKARLESPAVNTAAQRDEERMAALLAEKRALSGEAIYVGDILRQAYLIAAGKEEAESKKAELLQLAEKFKKAEELAKSIEIPARFRTMYRITDPLEELKAAFDSLQTAHGDVKTRIEVLEKTQRSKNDDGDRPSFREMQIRMLARYEELLKPIKNIENSANTVYIVAERMQELLHDLNEHPEGSIERLEQLEAMAQAEGELRGLLEKSSIFPSLANWAHDPEVFIENMKEDRK